MEFGVHHIIGLKVICTIEDNMLKLTLLNLAIKYYLRYTPRLDSRSSFIFALCERPRAESSGSQPGYRKLFPHGPHSSKNNFFGIKIPKGVTGSVPLCPIMALDVERDQRVNMVRKVKSNCLPCL